MSSTYTWDVFATVDGFASYNSDGDWGGYWGKHGPQFLERRLSLYAAEQRLVLGANTFRQFVQIMGPRTGALREVDAVNARMRDLPTTVISGTLADPLDWPDATVARQGAAEVVARLKADSPVPLRSHGSLSLNRSLLAAGLVDAVQLTVFPVLTGRTGAEPVFAGTADFDLELIDARTLDGRIQELTYRPSLHA